MPEEGVGRAGALVGQVHLGPSAPPAPSLLAPRLCASRLLPAKPCWSPHQLPTMAVTACAGATWWDGRGFICPKHSCRWHVLWDSKSVASGGKFFPPEREKKKMRNERDAKAFLLPQIGATLQMKIMHLVPLPVGRGVFCRLRKYPECGTKAGL